MYQAHLFDHIIKEVKLTAQSKRKAFYNLQIIEKMGIFFVVKTSGANGKVLDKRQWPAKDLVSAKKKYDRILKSKLNRGDHPRKYKKVA